MILPSQIDKVSELYPKAVYKALVPKGVLVAEFPERDELLEICKDVLAQVEENGQLRYRDFDEKGWILARLRKVVEEAEK